MSTRLRLAATIAVAIGMVQVAAVVPAAAVEPAHAEFAIRWYARDGGPATAEAAMALLDVRARNARHFQVDYYDLPLTLAAPPGFAAILRRREIDGGGKHAELTFKLRGDRTLAQWACPWRNADSTKAEVDFTFGAAGSVGRAYSYSCSRGDADTAAAALSATRKACSAMVRRWESGQLKVEEWQLPGGALMIEVSGNGRNAAKAVEKFRRRVAAPLLAAGAIPSTSSKTEIGGRCE
ncbi:MAG: hypothetical protein ABI607_09050 [Betaproteobacteria bacterium]